MANYRISPNAKDDLERIWRYGVDRWGMEAADAYHARHFSIILKNSRNIRAFIPKSIFDQVIAEAYVARTACFTGSMAKL